MPKLTLKKLQQLAMPSAFTDADDDDLNSCLQPTSDVCMAALCAMTTPDSDGWPLPVSAGFLCAPHLSVILYMYSENIVLSSMG